MVPEQHDQLREIERAALTEFAAADPSHDLSHIKRVVSTARFLLEQEGLDDDPEVAFTTLAACWLHDWVQTPKGTTPPGSDAERSAHVAEGLLAQIGVSQPHVDQILTAIREHSFSAGLPPSNLAAAILQDADRIDALGTLGIARMFAVAGAHGGQIYDPEDPAATHRSIDDRSFALDHIPAKLLSLPATMSTVSGRNLARERAQTVLDFYERFLAEVGCDPPPITPLQRLLMRGEIRARLIFPGEPTPRLLDAARALGVDPEQILKSLLFVAAAGESIMVVASGPARVSTERLASLTRLEDLQLAKPDVVRRQTTYDVGAVPPVGLPGELPVIVDEGVTGLSVAYGGGGRVDALLEIPPAEIVRINQARVARVVD